jgi:uncharacterized protein (DUF1778 family)
MKSVELEFRAPPQRWGLIEEMAHTLGKSVPDFMLEAAWEKARLLRQASADRPQAVSQDLVSFVLDADKFMEFTRQLGDQPLRNKRLQALQGTPACWDTKRQER